MSSSGCSSCSCSSFHPHLFLPLKCLGCPHPKAAHNGGAGGAAAAEDSEPITAATPAEPTPAHAPAPAPAAAAAAASSSSPAPQKPPPPLPSVLAAAPAPAAAAPAPAATLAAPAPPPKRGSMPPPIPSTLQKQWSGGAEPASTASPTAAGASAATSQPPQPTQPRPPPRPSIIAPAGTVLLGSGAFPARSAPPPLPASSASAASSPSNASAAPQTQSAPINIPASSSGSGSGPPPVPLHLRTDSGVNSAEVLFSPSPSTSASLAALLVGGGAGGTGGAAGTTPFSPASSISSPDPSNRGGSLNSRPPPLPSQPAAEPATASSTVLTSPKGVSASAGFSNASQGQDQQWVDPNYRPSFAQKLHHKFDVVVDQSNTGMHLLKRVRAFMQRFSSLQERYAAELSKITSLERNKLIASAHADGMSSCYTAWLGFFANMDELAVANQHFSEQLKEVTVEQLERFYGIGTQMVGKHTRTRTHNTQRRRCCSVPLLSAPCSRARACARVCSCGRCGA